jgi:sec-independent protein translocase protein TatC
MATQLNPNPNPNQLPPSPYSAPPEEPQQKTMGFFDHIDELRMRLTRCAYAVILGLVVSVFFTNDAIRYMSQSYGKPLTLLDPTDAVVAFFRVALLLGAIIAMPVITYHVFAFVVPALTNKERRWIFTALPGTFALFIGGVLFTWVYLVPTYVNFLKTFQGDIFEALWTAEAYITFVTTVLFWHGAAFETPLVFYVLGRLTLVNAMGMLRGWRYAIVGSAVAAAVITPTVDPVTMLVIMAVLLSLYGASIFLVFIAARLNRRALARLSNS